MNGSERVNSSKVKLETTFLSALGATCHLRLTLVSKWSELRGRFGLFAYLRPYSRLKWTIHTKYTTVTANFRYLGCLAAGYSTYVGPTAPITLSDGSLFVICVQYNANEPLVQGQHLLYLAICVSLWVFLGDSEFFCDVL